MVKENLVCCNMCGGDGQLDDILRGIIVCPKCDGKKEITYEEAEDFMRIKKWHKKVK